MALYENEMLNIYSSDELVSSNVDFYTYNSESAFLKLDLATDPVTGSLYYTTFESDLSSFQKSFESLVNTYGYNLVNGMASGVFHRGYNITNLSGEYQGFTNTSGFRADEYREKITNGVTTDDLSSEMVNSLQAVSTLSPADDISIALFGHPVSYAIYDNSGSGKYNIDVNDYKIVLDEISKYGYCTTAFSRRRANSLMRYVTNKSLMGLGGNLTLNGSLGITTKPKHFTQEYYPTLNFKHQISNNRSVHVFNMVEGNKPQTTAHNKKNILLKKYKGDIISEFNSFDGGKPHIYIARNGDVYFLRDYRDTFNLQNSSSMPQEAINDIVTKSLVIGLEGYNPIDLSVGSWYSRTPDGQKDQTQDLGYVFSYKGEENKAIMHWRRSNILDNVSTDSSDSSDNKSKRDLKTALIVDTANAAFTKYQPESQVVQQEYIDKYHSQQLFDYNFQKTYSDISSLYLKGKIANPDFDRTNLRARVTSDDMDYLQVMDKVQELEYSIRAKNSLLTKLWNANTQKGKGVVNFKWEDYESVWNPVTEVNNTKFKLTQTDTWASASLLINCLDWWDKYTNHANSKMTVLENTVVWAYLENLKQQVRTKQVHIETDDFDGTKSESGRWFGVVRQWIANRLSSIFIPMTHYTDDVDAHKKISMNLLSDIYSLPSASDSVDYNYESDETPTEVDMVLNDSGNTNTLFMTNTATNRIVVNWNKASDFLDVINSDARPWQPMTSLNKSVSDIVGSQSLSDIDTVKKSFKLSDILSKQKSATKSSTYFQSEFIYNKNQFIDDWSKMVGNALKAKLNKSTAKHQERPYMILGDKLQKMLPNVGINEMSTFLSEKKDFIWDSFIGSEDAIKFVNNFPMLDRSKLVEQSASLSLGINTYSILKSVMTNHVNLNDKLEQVMIENRQGHFILEIDRIWWLNEYQKSFFVSPNIEYNIAPWKHLRIFDTAGNTIKASATEQEYVIEGELVGYYHYDYQIDHFTMKWFYGNPDGSRLQANPMTDWFYQYVGGVDKYSNGKYKNSKDNWARYTWIKPLRPSQFANIKGFNPNDIWTATGTAGSYDNIVDILEMNFKSIDDKYTIKSGITLPLTYNSWFYRIGIMNHCELNSVDKTNRTSFVLNPTYKDYDNYRVRPGHQALVTPHWISKMPGEYVYSELFRDSIFDIYRNFTYAINDCKAVDIDKEVFDLAAGRFMALHRDWFIITYNKLKEELDNLPGYYRKNVFGSQLIPSVGKQCDQFTSYDSFVEALNKEVDARVYSQWDKDIGLFDENRMGASSRYYDDFDYNNVIHRSYYTVWNFVARFKVMLELILELKNSVMHINLSSVTKGKFGRTSKNRLNLQETYKQYSNLISLDGDYYTANVTKKIRLFGGADTRFQWQFGQGRKSTIFNSSIGAMALIAGSSASDFDGTALTSEDLINHSNYLKSWRDWPIQIVPSNHEFVSLQSLGYYNNQYYNRLNQQYIDIYKNSIQNQEIKSLTSITSWADEQNLVVKNNINSTYISDPIILEKLIKIQKDIFQTRDQYDKYVNILSNFEIYSNPYIGSYMNVNSEYEKYRGFNFFAIPSEEQSISLQRVLGYVQCTLGISQQRFFGNPLESFTENTTSTLMRDSNSGTRTLFNWTHDYELLRREPKGYIFTSNNLFDNCVDFSPLDDLQWMTSLSVVQIEDETFQPEKQLQYLPLEEWVAKSGKSTIVYNNRMTHTLLLSEKDLFKTPDGDNKTTTEYYIYQGQYEKIDCPKLKALQAVTEEDPDYKISTSKVEACKLQDQNIQPTFKFDTSIRSKILDLYNLLAIDKELLDTYKENEVLRELYDSLDYTGSDQSVGEFLAINSLSLDRNGLNPVAHDMAMELFGDLVSNSGILAFVNNIGQDNFFQYKDIIDSRKQMVKTDLQVIESILQDNK